jgi:type I restriction enzyme M protein
VLFFEHKPASETPWTTKLWIYDLRANERFRFLRVQDLQGFVARYDTNERQEREETKHFRAFDYEGMTRLKHGARLRE